MSRTSSTSRRLLWAGLIVLAAICAVVLLWPKRQREVEDQASAPRRGEAVVPGVSIHGGRSSGAAPSESSLPLASRSLRPADRTPRVALAGRVSSQPDGEAIRGAKLTIAAAGPATVETGEQGRYRFADLKPGVVRVRVRAEGYTPIPDRTISLRPDQPETEANFELTRAAVVEGRVEETDGRPIASAQLWIIDYQPAVPEEIAKPIVRNLLRVLDNRNSGIAKLARSEMAQRANRPEPVRSGADGRFAFAWAPVGRSFTIEALHESYAPGQSEALTLRAGEERRDVVVVLQQGASIAGAIQDPNGAAIAGARVAAVDAVAVPQGTIQSLAKGISLAVARQIDDASQSGESGAYLVARLLPGRYHVVAEADGFQYNTSPDVELAENEQATGVDVILKPAAVVSGRVLGPTGAPIPGAYVGTAVPNLENPSYDYTVTDQAGRYRLSHLDPNQIHWAVAWAEGYGWKLESWIKPPRDNLDFQLDYEASVAGQVVDAVTQEPIPSFRLQPMPQNVPPQIYFVLGAKVLEQGENLSLPFEDPEGRFQLPHLAAGDYQLTVWADGYIRNETRVAGLGPGEERKGVVIPLTPGAAVEGTVVEDAQEAKPIGGARVTVGQQRPEIIQRLLSEPPDPQNEAITDTDGHFYLAGLPAGKPATLSATAPGYLKGSATVTPSSDQLQQVQIKLRHGATVEGRVVSGDDSTPVASASVFIGQGGLLSNARGAVQTGADGRFTLSEAPPGSARLTVRHADYPEFTTDYFAVRSEGVTDVGDIRLAAPGKIEGHVWGPDQNPKEGVELILTVESATYPTATDRLGYYHFDRVPSGLHQVRMIEKVGLEGESPQPRGAQQVKEVRVESGQTAQADFILFPGARLYGQILSAGKPAEKKYTVRAQAQDPERGIFQEYAADVGDQNAYEMRDLPPGVYALIVTRVEGRAIVLTEEIQIAEADVQHDIVLPEGGIKGVVVDSASAPIASAQVEIQSPGVPVGPRGPRVRTGKDGAFAFTQVAPGKYTLVARHDNYGYSSTEVAVEEGQVVEGVRIQLRDKAPLVGVALFAHLQPPSPVQRLFVRLTDASGVRVYDDRVSVDGQGRYRIESLVPGYYQMESFTFSATLTNIQLEAAPTFETGVDVHGDAHDLYFQPGGSLTVVARTEAGEPVRTASVSLKRPDGGPVIYFGDAMLRTNDEGLCLLDHVPSGPHALVVTKDGFDPAVKEINLASGQSLTVPIALGQSAGSPP